MVSSLFLRPLRAVGKSSYVRLGISFPEGGMRRLPFLNGVRAFEATARGGSFARAAEELHVSPAAVSRLVRLLEQRLGVALVERGANRLALTAAGRTYQAGLTRILDSLAELTDQVTVASPPTGADGRGRPDLRDPLVDSETVGVPGAGARHRGPHHHRRPGDAVRPGLELRHHPRRRRLAGPAGGAAVRGRSAAGLRAGAGARPGDAGRPRPRDAAAGGARPR